MKRFNITPKLTLVFTLFAVTLLLSLTIPTYIRGRISLREASYSELLTTALEKEAALTAWVKDRQHSLEDIAHQTHLRDLMIEWSAADPGSTAADKFHQEIVDNLMNWAGSLGHRYTNLDLIDAETGLVIVSTNPEEEGKYRESQSYFILGKQAANVQNPYYDLASGKPVMTAAAPVFSRDGTTMAVLAGNLNLQEMNEIIQRRSGLHYSDDSFLINPSNLLVTQPRLLPDPAVLQRGFHTEAVTLCLQHNNGVLEADDYRGIPAIIVYRWLPDRQMCLINKIDQHEAYAPVRTLGSSMSLIGGLVLLLGSLAAFFMSRSIARPVLQLLNATGQIGKGNLNYRIELASRDELGALGNGFNQMAAALSENDQKLRNWTNELETIVEQRTKAMRASEERYRLLAETSPDMIFVIDTNDQVVYVNQLAATQFGKNPQDVIDKPRSQLFPLAIIEKQTESLQQVFLTGKTLASESPIDFPGTRMWLDTQLVPIIDDTGTVSAIMGVSRDITERKQFEQFIQEEKALSDSIINSLPGIFYMFDPQGKFLRWNNNFEQVSGYSSDEISDMSPLEFFSREDQPQVQASIEKTFAAGEAQVEANFFSKTGQSSPYLFTGLRVQIKNQLLLIGTGIDITKRMLAEEKLRTLNERFELATNAAELGVWDWDVVNNFLVWNDRMYLQYGVNKENFPAAYEAWIAGLHPDDAAFANEAVQQALRGEKEFNIQFRIVRPDRSIRHIGGYADVLRNKNGDPIRMTGINFDITERIVVEENLFKANLDLARSNSELERFAYVASHDLQEPLRMVTSYLQLLERRYKDRLDGDALEFIGYAIDGSARMKTLINDLLTYSRVGTRGRDFATTDFNIIIEEVLSTLSLTIEQEKARITCKKLPQLMADEGQIQQLFQNLIANAIKFHGEEPPEIHIAAKKEKDEWVFSIKDNGIGIDPQFFDRVFIIFQRLHNREEYDGTGIGLAISKRIVERHGGRIWIESKPGSGSTFFFTIPVIGETK